MRDLILYGASYPDTVKVVQAVNRQEMRWCVRGFIADKPAKQNQMFMGFPVLRAGEMIARLRDQGCTFFNNVLPTNIGGDVFRIKDAARYTNSKTLSSAVIFVDRLIGFAGLFALALGAVVFGGQVIRALPGLNWLWIGLAAICGVLLVVLAVPEVVEWGLKPLHRLSSAWITKRV